MKNQLEYFLLFFQKQLVPSQQLVKRGLFFIAVFFVCIWLVASLSVFFIPKQILLLMQISDKLGTLSLLLFVLTLLPGIITRLQINQKSLSIIAIIITLFRRQLGILMFITAFLHMSLGTTLPLIAFQLIPIANLSALSIAEKIRLSARAFPPTLRSFEQIGMVAWMILLPVWLTSNDFSQKLLGKKWKTLQRLTYVALWFIFIHVALQKESLALVLLLVGLLEMYSWVSVWRRKQASRTSSSSV